MRDGFFAVKKLSEGKRSIGSLVRFGRQSEAKNFLPEN